MLVLRLQASTRLTQQALPRYEVFSFLSQSAGPGLTKTSKQAKINDRGIAALAYNVKLSTAVTLGLGASFDTQNLNAAAHKVGASFTFEG